MSSPPEKPVLATLLLAVALALPASAKQNAWNVEQGAATWTFDVRWTDADGKKHKVNFDLPAADVEEDLEERVRFRMNEATKYAAAEVNAWGKTLSGGTRVTATAKKGGRVELSAKGTDKSAMKDALSKAQTVQKKAMSKYAKDHGFTMSDEGSIRPAHAFHANRYSDDMGPIVEALGGATKNKRAFADKALSFVQAIPYEKSPNNRDRFRRPLSLLGKNQGDCDSKVVLYLAIMRKAYPKLPLAVINIPGHAYAAIGLDAQKGDDKLKIDGKKWVAVEPVGPAMHPVGELDKNSAKYAKKGKFDAYKVRKN